MRQIQATTLAMMLAFGARVALASSSMVDYGIEGAASTSVGAPEPDLLLGDANMDNRVDGLDLQAVTGNWLANTEAGKSAGDLNGDGRVDGLDLQLVTGNWLKSVEVGPPAIPEPVTLLSGLMVVSALGAYIRRRTQGAKV